ncbi:MAG: hypothetical protein WC723_04075 [Candidatus Omnitrophota bacterium]
MKGKAGFKKYISIAVLLLLGILFIAKFGGPAILRLYIETGIGTCSKIPILCLAPEGTINSEINKAYAAELVPHKFPQMAISIPMTISIPKGFSIVQQRTKRVYYKKRRPEQKQPIIYLLRQEPGFFINLYPRLKKEGIADDYEFLKRVMYAKPADIKDITGAFFLIMKSIFIPDLGDQRNAKMAQFSIAGRKGFINYNLAGPEHYFDCNVINAQGAFFKIYIKDKGANLDLDKVLTIVSTVN